MKLTSRSGNKIPFVKEKIKFHTDRAVADLGLDGERLLAAVVNQLVDGMSTVDVQTTIIKTCVDFIDIDQPDWTFAASRALSYSMRKESNGGHGYHTLREQLESGLASGHYTHELEGMYDLDYLNEFIVADRDNLFNYMGMLTIKDRYLVRNNECIKELPQHMFMLIAMFLATIEPESIRHDKAIEFYNILSQFEAMTATPTLSSARTPSGQLSSCYVQKTPDSIEGIFDGYKEAALESKGGGGVGWDWTDTRASGGSIDGHEDASSGYIPFLKIANDVGIAVDQLGFES